MKFLKKCLKQESAFTLVEVLIAALIASVALSGLVYLVGSISNLSMQAKANQIAAQIAAAEVERIRTMDFDLIGFKTPGENEPSGIFDREVTTQSGTIAMKIKYSISWVDDPNTPVNNDYKRIGIELRWDRPKPGRYSVATLVSHASKRSPGKIIIPPPPELLVPPSPSPDSRIYGTVPISISISENSMLFSALEVRIGNNLAGRLDQIQPHSSSAQMTYYWDTTLFPDGRYEIQAFAYEARGGTSSRSWYYIVDNSAPTETPVLYFVSAGKDSSTFKWTIINDGLDRVSSYQFKYWGISPSFDISTLTATVDLDISEVTQEYAQREIKGLLPWSFYWAYCRGVSYEKYSPQSNWISFKTKINLTVTRSGKDAILKWTPAPSWESITKYQVWKKTSTGETIVADNLSPSLIQYTVSKGWANGVAYKVKAWSNSTLKNESDWVYVQ